MGVEGGARRSAFDDVVVDAARAVERAEAQCVALVAVDVDAVEQGRAVARDVEAAEGEELVALGLDVLVEKHLLAGKAP